MIWALVIGIIAIYLFCLATAHDRIDDQREFNRLRAEWKAGRGGPILPLIFRTRIR